MVKKKTTIKIGDKQPAYQTVQAIQRMVQEHSDYHDELMRQSQEKHAEFHKQREELFRKLMVEVGRPEEEWRLWTVDLSYAEHGLAFLGKTADGVHTDPMAALLESLAVPGRPN